jgi:outer membrane protein TolC
MLTFAAFYFHPSLEVARAHWRVTLAEIQTAGARPNPTLSVTPEYDFDATKGVSPWLPAVNFDLPIETAGKRSHRITRAQHLSEAARLNIATTAWQVRSNLRARLIEVTAEQQRVMRLLGQVQAHEQILKLLEQRAEAGAIAGSELAVSRIALQRARLDLADAESRRAEARARLAEAIGIPTAALDSAELAFDPLKEPALSAELTSVEARRAALQSRSDILGALAEYAASQSALRLEIAKQYPDVHLGTGYQWDQGESKWQLGVTAELPVLNRNQGAIAEAKARREEAAAKFNALQAKVLAEIERAVEVFRVSQKNSAAVQALAGAQLKQRDSVAQQLKAGAVDQLDFLNAQLELQTAALAELDARVKLQQALGALEDAVQRPMNLPQAIFNGSDAQPRAPMNQTQGGDSSLPGKHAQ